jgi:hypothetical protein
MITVQSLHAPSAITTPDQAPPTTSPTPVTSQVIEIFHKPSTQIQSEIPLQARQRTEQLLRYAVTKEQPSVAEQISRLIENAHAPLTDATLRDEVNQLLDQPSALNPQKTYAQLVQEILDDRASTRPVLSRATRHLLENDTASTSPNAVVGQFAEGLIDNGDRQLAIGVANSLIRQRLAAEQGSSPVSEDKVLVPRDSTFGQAWNELADALDSEPFKSFAQDRLIDTSKLSIDTTGILTEHRDTRPVTFDPNLDPQWAAASAAIMAAVKKITAGRPYTLIGLQGRDHASASDIASFYGLNLGRIEDSDTLFTIGQLFRDGNFSALTSEDPLYATPYAPIKRRQKEAIARVVNLPPDQLKQRLENFAPSTVAQKVKDADQTLAQQSSQALIKLTGEPRARDYEFPVMLKEVPEYSTFNQVRKNLLTALTGNTFSTFVRNNNIDPRSININPVTGDLTAKVNGVDTAFNANDLSGWSAVWDEIKDAVQQMNNNSGGSVTFPTPPAAELYQVLNFYNEGVPEQQDIRQADYQQRRLQSLLGKSAEMASHNGFKALINPNANDPRSAAVLALQQAVTQQLKDAPVPLSSLETLAAAVNAGQGAPVQSVDSPQDELARGDSALAATVGRVMLELKTNATQASSKIIEPIPANSLFGQWWDLLGKALKGRGFTEWARQQNVDLTSLRFDPAGMVLIAKVNGVDQRFEAKDFAQKYPEHFDALSFVVNAAQALVPHNKSIMLSYTAADRAPYELVAHFYGIDNADYSSEQFANTAALMGRTQRFPEQPENPTQHVNRLTRHKTALGDSNDRYALIDQLKRGIINRNLSENSTRFAVDPDSSHQPKGVTNANAFIAENGWYPVKSAADHDNLQLALSTPVPQAPALGNRWGFLSTDLSLSPAQRRAVTSYLEMTGSANRLFNIMNARVPHLSSDPDQALEQLLSSARGHDMATDLQEHMKGAATPYSLKQWLLTAIVLDLDPAAGTKRTSVAGYDFTKPGNWGRPASEISQDVTEHLVASKKMSPAHAAIAARVLMAGFAPQFLVKELPTSLLYGTHQWAAFHTAVNRIEQIAPGAASSMTYKQVMDFNQVKPISRTEQLHLIRAQTNPVIDWGIANRVIDKNETDNYSNEEVEKCRQALTRQTNEVGTANRYLRSHPIPTRTSLALENLRAQFGTEIPYEDKVLRRKDRKSVKPYSVVDLYVAGELGNLHNYNLKPSSSDSAWPNGDSGIPVKTLQEGADKLPDVNAQYERAFDEDYAPRREHSIVRIRDMLSRLPVEDRNRLAYGSVEYFSVRETDTSFWTHLKAEKGTKGRHGIIIRATGADGKTSDIGIFPDADTVKKLPGLPNPMPIGGSRPFFGKFTDRGDEGPRSLPLDFAAFSSSAAPRTGVHSNVIVDRITPDTMIDGELVSTGMVTFGNINPNSAPAYASEQLKNIATTTVDSLFLRKDEFKAINRGYDGLEHLDKASTPLEKLNFLARMVPGVSSIEDLYQGHYVEAGKDLFFDALGLVLPGVLGKVWSFEAEGVERAAVSIGEEIAESGVENVARSVAVNDVTSTSTSKSLTSLNRMQGGALSDRVALERPPTSDMANGIIPGSAGSAPFRGTAVRQGENWYAYDAKTMTAYGPPLEGFRSETSVALKSQRLPDGTDVVMPDRLFAEDAQVINRATYSDVKIGDKVYRYDPKEPGVLTDLDSADHFKSSAKDLEAFCPPAGPRKKRATDGLCFTKVVADLNGNTAKLVQGLEHMRLHPSPEVAGKPQTLIYERRLFDVVEKDGVYTTVQRSQQTPIEYLPTTTGTLIKDPNFGLFDTETFANLEQNTRIVKLDAISSLSNDKRELRGTIALVQTSTGATERYVVVEADPLTFYYSRFEANSTVLNFKKVEELASPFEVALVKKHVDETKGLLELAGVPSRKEFVSLPSMDSAFSKLEAAGYTPTEVNNLKASIASFSNEKKREFVYQLMNKLNNSNNQLILKSVDIEALDKPADFASLTAEQQNKFYADGAKQSVDSQVKATGVGAVNKLAPNEADDSYRMAVAEQIVTWMRSSAVQVKNILKYGAGNCGEMAEASAEIIRKSGGTARTWYVDGGDHAFTVVGGPPAVGKSTVDFSEAEWKDAWIVDPWADISCKASEYTGELKKKMAEWAAKGQQIYTAGDWRSPLYPRWISELTTLKKRPDI